MSVPPREVTETLGVDVLRDLGGRASANWLVRRGDRRLVLRRDLDLMVLGRERLGAVIGWRERVRAAAGGAGWPVARAVGTPSWVAGAWWTLETELPGEPGVLTPERHAALIESWQRMPVDLEALGQRPEHRDRLEVLTDPGVVELIARVEDGDDRRWLRRRWEQARELADGVDLGSSSRRLVHGDLVTHNLLWEDEELTGVLDLELAAVDRRVAELTLVWRCRYDDVVRAYDALAPLSEDEWRLLLVDWWVLVVDLCLFHLRRGRGPGRWELDGLRRTSPLARRICGTD